MPSFKNLSQVEQYIQGIMEDIIRNELRKVVTEVWLEEQKKRVYDVYQPNTYERREEDGLSDPENITMVIETAKNRIVGTLINVAKGNPDMNGKVDPTKSHYPLNNGEYLNPYIESERDFDRKKGGGFLPPRPYTEFAVDELVRGVERQRMLQAINDGLKKHGIRANIK